VIFHIVAVDQRNGFAKDGAIPWSLPQEKDYYRSHIKNKVVLQGASTYNPARAKTVQYNYVLSTSPSLQIINGESVGDISTVLNKCKDQDLWVIGGESVFTPTIDRADRLYITRVEADFNCDRFYPDVPEAFRLVSKSGTHYENGLTYIYEVYDRLQPGSAG